MKEFARFAMLTMLFSACQAATAQIPKPLQGVQRIVCLGDSITQSGERPGGYVWLLRHYLSACYPDAKIEVRNAGISGNKSTDMIARLDRDVLAKHPDLVTVSVGVNDVWHGFYDQHPKGDGPLGIPLDAYIHNVEEITSRITATGARVVILTATPIGEDLSGPENKKQVAYNEALRSLARKRGYMLAETHNANAGVISAYRAATGSERNFLTVDGVHMNPQGNQLMADILMNALEIPEKARVDVAAKVDHDAHLAPTPMTLPAGRVVSDNMPATSSSATPGYTPSVVTAWPRAEAGQRWCAENGSFSPAPWWCVDLGSEQALSGIAIQFFPRELDTWKYRVEGSVDGKDYSILADRSNSDSFLTEEALTFPDGSRARWVRIVFTAETSAMNWASLLRVAVYAK